MTLQSPSSSSHPPEREAKCADCESLADAGVTRCWVDSGGIFHPRPGAATLLGLAEPVPLWRFARQIQKDQRKQFFALVRKAISEGRSAGRLLLDGASVEGKHVRVSLRRIDGAEPASIIDLTMVDVTREFSELDLLQRSAQNLRYIVEYNPQFPWIADAQGNILDFTDRWLECSGLERTEASGNGWLEKAHPDDIGQVTERIMHSLQTSEPFDARVRLLVNGEYRWMRARSYPRRDETGAIVRWYGYTEDIHENVLVEEQIRWNSEHDSLTGLPNRVLFNSSLDKTLANSMQSLKRIGLLLLDVDDFKDVNDLMGHHAGDQLLQHFASRLIDSFGAQALIARLGGDEFGIVISDVVNKEELLAQAGAALDIRESFNASARSFECRASIGAAIFPDHGRTAVELMRHADLALYHAKAQGKGQLQLFDRSLLNHVQERVAMVNRARTAVREGTILAYYQPKVALCDGSLVGFEALLRWRDANGNIRSPAEIYAAFDDHDVADMIGQTMTSQVFSDLAGWKREGLDFGHIAINVSSSELRRKNFVERLLANMDKYSIATTEIEIEITEGVFLGRGSNATREAIDLLFKHNIPMALDDFGTGFASLSHLRSLPVSTLKIDKSFVMGMTTRGSDHAIVSALISLGRGLHMKVVAEGIEHDEQAVELRALGCEYAQGFLFARPTASEHIPRLIRSWGQLTCQIDTAPDQTTPIKTLIL